MQAAQVTIGSTHVICGAVGAGSLVVLKGIQDRLLKKLTMRSIISSAFETGSTYAKPLKIIGAIAVGSLACVAVYSICNCFYRSYATSKPKSPLLVPSNLPDFHLTQSEIEQFELSRFFASEFGEISDSEKGDVDSPSVLSPRNEIDIDKLAKSIAERKEFSKALSIIFETIAENPGDPENQKILDETVSACNTFLKQHGKKPVKLEQLTEAFEELAEEQTQLSKKVQQVEDKDLKKLQRDLEKFGLKLADS
jgi:hypothetical protein